MVSESEKVESVASDICCPLFRPKSWHNIKHTWTKRLFLKDSVPEIFHIPLPGTYEKAITRMWKKAENAGAAPAREDFLLLAHDPSAFKGELYMAVTKNIPDEDVVELTGSFFSKVFEGSYGEIRKFLGEMNAHLTSNKMVSKKDYIYFPYCPKCAKKYGHNYIVVLSDVSSL